MTVEGTAGEARDVLDRGNAPLQAVPTVPTTNARRESRVASIMALEAHMRELPFSVAALEVFPQKARSPDRPDNCDLSISGAMLRPARQDFALNLSAKRRLCNTVGARIIEGAARCCAVSAACSRAAATTNLARSSLALVLRAIFGGAKSCALVNLFMICPPMVGCGSPYDDQILTLIAAISWHVYRTCIRRCGLAHDRLGSC